MIRRKSKARMEAMAGTTNLTAGHGSLFEEKIFKYALTVSVLTHLLIFLCLFFVNMHSERILPEVTEVVYYAPKKQQGASLPMREIIKSSRSYREESRPKILTRNEIGQELVLNDFSGQTYKPKMNSKGVYKINNVLEKRHINIPVLNAEKITNPKYLSYYDKIRDKIRNRAYLYVNDSRFQAGEVYLTFVIGSDGGLKRIKVINEKTYANDYLRGIGLRSIKESSPFSLFPKDLNYPELTFNVVISFEVND